jgi:small subunit ribosomal protein S9
MASYYGTGRRKESVARVWLTPGNGAVSVNGSLLEEYFSRKTLEKAARQPLEVTGTVDKFNVRVNVRGGGISGQAGAIRHGIARALVQSDKALGLTLRKTGFLTRDPRMKERKKYGQKGARARFQFSKR